MGKNQTRQRTSSKKIAYDALEVKLPLTIGSIDRFFQAHAAQLRGFKASPPLTTLSTSAYTSLNKSLHAIHQMVTTLQNDVRSHIIGGFTKSWPILRNAIHFSLGAFASRKEPRPNPPEPPPIELLVEAAHASVQILDAIAYFPSLSRVHNLCSADAQICRILGLILILESTDPEFDFRVESSTTALPLSVIYSFGSLVSDRPSDLTEKSIKQLIDDLGGDLQVIAHCIVDHLRYAASLPIMMPEILRVFVVAITILGGLSPLCEALVAAHVVRPIVTILCRLTDGSTILHQPIGPGQLVVDPLLIDLAISNCCLFLSMALEIGDGVSHYLEAIDTGILTVFARLAGSAYVRFVQSHSTTGALLVFTSALPKCLLYSPVLTLAASKLKNIELPDNGGAPRLVEAFETYRNTVANYMKVYRRMDGIANEPKLSCGNQNCPRIFDPHTFRSCAACQRVYYCGRECQRFDWRHGEHKSRCQNPGEPQGNKVLSRKGVAFIGNLMRASFNAHSTYITSFWVGIGRPNAIAVGFDFSEFPPIIKATTMDKLDRSWLIFRKAEWIDSVISPNEQGGNPVVIVHGHVPRSASGGQLHIESYDFEMRRNGLVWIPDHAGGMHGGSEEEYAESEDAFDGFVPGMVEALLDEDEQEMTYASAWRKRILL